MLCNVLTKTFQVEEKRRRKAHCVCSRLRRIAKMTLFDPQTSKDSFRCKFIVSQVVKRRVIDVDERKNVEDGISCKNLCF